MRVVVEPHRPEWAAMYEAEAAAAVAALGPAVVAIHHVGSTAIPGIHAKPIIDLLVEATDLEVIDALAEGMIALGYEALGEFGLAGRRYFRRNDDAGVRTHHVHVFAAGSPEVRRHLDFRDFLIAHPDHARAYSDLKRRLAAAHPDDAEAYMDGKDAFIRDIDARAAAWRAG